MNAIGRLHEYGQSPWYDNLTRILIESSGLQQLVANDGIVGVTSNPSIFEKAMANTDAYDAQLVETSDLDITDSYWELVLRDIAGAADILRPTYDRLKGADGYVSIEVSPDVAKDADKTIEQAVWLHERLDRPNVMVKIPGTVEGLVAIEEMIARGKKINVTLIFSLERHQEVINAYLRGLERLRDNGGSLDQVASVASFFVSRVDTEADRRLPEGSSLRGRVAVANAKLAYQLFCENFSGDRWNNLASLGARTQRPLWASTSTKNPAYSDTLYVDELVGSDTVNTLAQSSIDALRDHGNPQPNTITAALDEASRVMDQLSTSGVDYKDLTDTLEQEGVTAFSNAFHDCLETLEKQRHELTS